jgi:hypothetical protein
VKSPLNAQSATSFFQQVINGKSEVMEYKIRFFFMLDQGLRAHKKNCHSDERPFACDCGKAFKTKCSLVIHIRYGNLTSLFIGIYNN